ncbi:MAG TPA: TolC family protein [Pyrinomonadaceae bacterium]|jgi:cobalt-zinc-cadmium efflux system outer membrane protein|nr:TolC family protein [Pyrinomonadaceae bacterium]
MLRRSSLLILTVTFQAATFGPPVFGQDAVQLTNQPPTLSRYFDPKSGMTADEAVAYALSHNADLLAARKEIEAARALVRQAALRANPMIDVERKEQLNGSDNDTMIGGTLPLELGGRRSARILVAQRELEMKERLLTDRERLLAAEVKIKFGQALGEMLKLAFTENLLTTTDRGYRLVAARVTEGRTAPLEQNMVLVEVNRIRSLRETGEGKVQIVLLELRNLIGMAPEESVRLRGDLNPTVEPVPSVAVVTEVALKERPDAQAARAAEALAEAQIEQARSEGRFDASVSAKYDLMNFGFPQRGFDEAGRLVPINGRFHSLAVGVNLYLPVRNRNQGAIEAAVAEKEAATRRREFTELTVRREIATSFARYEQSMKAAEIYRVGVRDQANANLQVVRQTYELGSKTLLDFIAEQRRFIEVETSFIDSLLETYLAHVDIERATSSPELIKK